jgi:hypothetical protein
VLASKSISPNFPLFPSLFISINTFPSLIPSTFSMFIHAFFILGYGFSWLCCNFFVSNKTWLKWFHMIAWSHQGEYWFRNIICRFP